MIFKKLLKGTDLTFDINLEKEEYRPSEIVRGTVTVKTEKSSKIRKLTLFSEGKESTIITIQENSTSGTGSRRSTTRTYSETNTFFSKDLSHLLQESVSSNNLEDGILDILTQNKDIPFEFELPSEDSLFSSYKGKHANITYAVKATADIAKRFDVNKEEHFSVFSSNKNKVVASPLADEENKEVSTIADPAEDEYNPPSLSPKEEDTDKETGKESYSARFERLFGKKSRSNNNVDSGSRHKSRSFTFSRADINIGFGSIFTKGREHYLKENSQARIELLNNNNNNIQYSPGHLLKGNVILLAQHRENEKENKEAIRGMEITLSGLEHAFAQGHERVSRIEKYETKIDLDSNGGNDFDDYTIPFEFQIPDNVYQSYTGKYSEYFWGLEAKLNVAWSSDINARTIIEVV